jgi:hypothetical protein
MDPLKSNRIHLNLQWSGVAQALWKARYLLLVIAVLALIVAGAAMTAP